MIRLLIAFATLAVFGHTLSMIAMLGKVGHEHGWWGDGLWPITGAVVLAVALTALFIGGLVRLTNR